MPTPSPSEIVSRAGSPPILIPRHFPRRICISVNLDAPTWPRVISGAIQDNVALRDALICEIELARFLSSTSLPSLPAYPVDLSRSPFYPYRSLLHDLSFSFLPSLSLFLLLFRALYRSRGRAENIIIHEFTRDNGVPRRSRVNTYLENILSVQIEKTRFNARLLILDYAYISCLYIRSAY